MALEMQDLMALKSMGNEGSMTPYEQYMVGYKQSKRPSGVAIAGLTVASVAAVAGATAWIFGGMQASAKAKEAKDWATSDHIRDTLKALGIQVKDTKDGVEWTIE